MSQSPIGEPTKCLKLVPGWTPRGASTLTWAWALDVGVVGEGEGEGNVTVGDAGSRFEASGGRHWAQPPVKERPLRGAGEAMARGLAGLDSPEPKPDGSETPLPERLLAEPALAPAS